MSTFLTTKDPALDHRSVKIGIIDFSVDEICIYKLEMFEERPIYPFLEENIPLINFLNHEWQCWLLPEPKLGLRYEGVR